MLDALVQLHKPRRKECCLNRMNVHLQNRLPSNRLLWIRHEVSFAAAPDQQHVVHSLRARRVGHVYQGSMHTGTSH